MESSDIIQELDSLPPEAKRQVVDFIAFLKTRYQAEPGAAKSKSKRKLADEPFIGMWRDREDLKDSSAWVRELRRREWERPA